MNKKDIVRAVSQETGFSQKDITTILDLAQGAVTYALTQGEKVNISGFGIFEIVERAAREGVNPQTMEKITIPASKAVKYRASSTLKKAVRMLNSIS